MVVVIDNITVAKDCRPPNALIKAKGRPFEYRGIDFAPKYSNGMLCRYEGKLRNLKIFWYPSKVFISNSIHKFWLGNNYTNFHLCDMKAAIETLNYATGINFNDAIITKLEHGCNIVANAVKAYRSLKSYKSKDFYFMRDKGKEYGAVCDFTDYRIKGYDKSYQVKQVDGININESLFRWEIALNRMRSLEGVLNTSPITIRDLLMPDSWQVLAKDSILKYKKTVKMEQLNLHKLKSTHEKRVLAEMLVPEIREDLKRHHKETYKRDRRIYNRIMANKSICEGEDLTPQMRAKYDHLINGNSD